VKRKRELSDALRSILDAATGWLQEIYQVTEDEAVQQQEDVE
jgi:hypothetical protein